MEKVTFEQLQQKVRECNYFGNFSILRNLDTSGVTDFSFLFKDCDQLKNLNFVYNWDLSNAVCIEGIFKNCINLEDIRGCSSWDLSHISKSDMKEVFFNVDKLDLISKNLFVRKQMKNQFIIRTYDNLSEEKLLFLYNNFIDSIEYA